MVSRCLDGRSMGYTVIVYANGFYSAFAKILV